jgi:hypothetical protein
MIGVDANDDSPASLSGVSGGCEGGGQGAQKRCEQRVNAWPSPQTTSKADNTPRLVVQDDVRSSKRSSPIHPHRSVQSKQTIASIRGTQAERHSTLMNNSQRVGGWAARWSVVARAGDEHFSVAQMKIKWCGH